MIAAAGFRSALSGWSFLSAAVIGAAGASIVVLVARRRGCCSARAWPSRPARSCARRDRRRRAADPGLVRGLRPGDGRRLGRPPVSAPPADLTDELRALPFTVAWLAAAVGGEIARHSRRPGLPAIGPLLALALSLLFTVEEQWLALLQGAGILAGTLALIAIGTARGPGVRRTPTRRRPP